jgi:aspartate aminotransferase-like enzyme
VQNCRARGFGIWPTLSEPVQVRIGILNQLSEAAIAEIVSRFADAMTELGASIDRAKITDILAQHYDRAALAD